jgi:AbiTii
MDKSEEILHLAEEILKNIELQEISLSNIVLRCSRLARITGNQPAMDLFKYELTGYPADDQGFVLAEAFQLARYANRTFRQKDKVGIIKEYLFPQTVAELENELEAAKEQMKVAFDRDISVSSANPTQHVWSPIGNGTERAGIRLIITEKSKKLDQLKSGYYNYVLGVYYETKFKNITEDIFGNRKLIVDKALSVLLPTAFEKFVSVYTNLQSEKPEDWANAVHSCRRILKDFADFLCPATDEVIDIGNHKTVKLSNENYIVRLKQFIKLNINSTSLKKVIGSNLEFIGDRIDSIYKSTTKGTHAKVEQKEAESYVMYTYMLIGDILELYKPKE